MFRILLALCLALICGSFAEATNRQRIVVPRQRIVVAPQRFVAPQRIIVQQPQRIIVAPQHFVAPQQIIVAPPQGFQSRSFLFFGH